MIKVKISVVNGNLKIVLMIINDTYVDDNDKVTIIWHSSDLKEASSYKRTEFLFMCVNLSYNPLLRL